MNFVHFKKTLIRISVFVILAFVIFTYDYLASVIDMMENMSCF